MSADTEVVERRKRQRVLVRRDGVECFRVAIAGESLPVLDLSLEGFAVPASTPPEANREFAFVLQCHERDEQIGGRARVVNFVGGVAGGQAGCLFNAFDGDGAARLQAWLTKYVLDNAWVPISEKDAVSIVAGPSLI